MRCFDEFLASLEDALRFEPWSFGAEASNKFSEAVASHYIPASSEKFCMVHVFSVNLWNENRHYAKVFSVRMKL
jgi:hypothetical protein